MNGHGKRCDCDECFVFRRYNRIVGSAWFRQLPDDGPSDTRAADAVRSALIDDPLTPDDKIREWATNACN